MSPTFERPPERSELNLLLLADHDSVREYVLYPSDTPDAKLATMWIRAEESAISSLWEMR